MINTIAINKFVERQTKDSPHSYCDRGMDFVLHVTKAHFHLAVPGYKDGVVLVPVPPEGFWSSLCELQDGDVIEGTFSGRQEGESPRVQIWIKGKQKQPAKSVWIVCYRHDVLAKDHANDTECEWEIVSINASDVVENEPGPMPVGTLLANHFHVEGSNDGGTSTNMSAAEFVEALRKSHEYWKNKMNSCPSCGE